MSLVEQINPKEAFQLLKTDNTSLLVDVRTYEEFNFVGVVNADSFSNRMILLPWQLSPNMDLNQFFIEKLIQETSRLFQDKAKDAKIIFLCRTGARSNQAANQALAIGFKNCFNLVNGFEGDLDELSQRGKINGWKANLLPWRQK